LFPSFFPSCIPVAFSQEPARRATSPVVMRIETKFMVISLAVRPGWCRESWQPWARLPSDGVSGPHTNGAIARLRGGR
jgi:hypothetical protein